jgi:hypothetical protein
MLGEVEALKAQRKRVSKEVGTLMGQKIVSDKYRPVVGKNCQRIGVWRA